MDSRKRPERNPSSRVLMPPSSNSSRKKRRNNGASRSAPTSELNLPDQTQEPQHASYSHASVRVLLVCLRERFTNPRDGRILAFRFQDNEETIHTQIQNFCRERVQLRDSFNLFLLDLQARTRGHAIFPFLFNDMNLFSGLGSDLMTQRNTLPPTSTFETLRTRTAGRIGADPYLLVLRFVHDDERGSTSEEISQELQYLTPIMSTVPRGPVLRKPQAKTSSTASNPMVENSVLDEVPRADSEFVRANKDGFVGLTQYLKEEGLYERPVVNPNLLENVLPKTQYYAESEAQYEQFPHPEVEDLIQSYEQALVNILDLQGIKKASGFFIGRSRVMTTLHSFYSRDPKNNRFFCSLPTFQIQLVHSTLSQQLSINECLLFPKYSETINELGYDIAIFSVNFHSSTIIPLPFDLSLVNFLDRTDDLPFITYQRVVVMTLIPGPIPRRQLSNSPNVLVNFNRCDIYYRNRTAKTWSGSPVFNSSGILIAIHRAGQDPIRSGSGILVESEVNCGVRLDLFLHQYFACTRGKHPDEEQIRDAQLWIPLKLSLADHLPLFLSRILAKPPPIFCSASPSTITFPLLIWIHFVIQSPSVLNELWTSTLRRLVAKYCESTLRISASYCFLDEDLVSLLNQEMDLTLFTPGSSPPLSDLIGLTDLSNIFLKRQTPHIAPWYRFDGHQWECLGSEQPNIESPVFINTRRQGSEELKIPHCGIDIPVHDIPLTSSIQSTPLISAIPCGFANLGNTCYFNSILQSLIWLKGLIYYFQELDASPGPLVRALGDLVTNTQASSVSHRPFFSLCMSSFRLNPHQQQDAHEVLCHILNLLKEESNQFGLIFEFKMNSELKCCESKHTSSKEEQEFILSVHVHENSTTQKIPFQDCLNNYLKPELVGVRCPSCDCQSASRCYSFRCISKVLIFELKIFDNNGAKLHPNLHLNDSLNVTVVPHPSSDITHCFKLRAVVFHLGESIHSGHYFSYLAPGYQVVDADVSPGSIDQSLEQASPYILFYELESSLEAEADYCTSSGR